MIYSFLFPLNSLHFCEAVPPYFKSEYWGFFLAVTVSINQGVVPKGVGEEFGGMLALTLSLIAQELLEVVDLELHFSSTNVNLYK